MSKEKKYFTYIATNYPRNTTIYIGMTNNVVNRESQHALKINKNSFTDRYNINRVVYYETYTDVYRAIAREKQLKSGSRQKKIDLINSINPEWKEIVDF